MNNYYDRRYFAWQKKAGLYGAAQDIRFYEKQIKPTDTVLDFGCGGGYILSALPGQHKYGVDINEKALQVAQSFGIRTYTSLTQLPRNVKFDVIITHHTLEHLENPHEALVELKKHMQKKGKIIGVLPLDDWRNQKNYRMKDINNHLYTWTPLLLGNLLKACDYRIHSIDIVTAAWLPLSRYYFRFTPKVVYYPLSSLWSMLIRSRQLRFVISIRS